MKYALSVVLASFCLGLFSCVKQSASRGDLEVASVAGSVKLLGQAGKDAPQEKHGDAGSMAEKPLEKGDRPGPGQEIRTAEKSLADMVYRAIGVIRVYQSTAVKVDALVDKADADMSLSKGRLLVVMDRLGKNARFTVRTPSLTVAIRGTGFSIDVKEGRTRVEVLRGSVEITPRADGAEIPGVTWTAGPGTYVDLDEKEAAASKADAKGSPVKRLSGKEAESLRRSLRHIGDGVLDRLDRAAREEFDHAAGGSAEEGGPVRKKPAGSGDGKAPGVEDDRDRAAREARERADEERRAKEKDRADGRP